MRFAERLVSSRAGRELYCKPNTRTDDQAKLEIPHAVLCNFCKCELTARRVRKDSLFRKRGSTKDDIDLERACRSEVSQVAINLLSCRKILVLICDRFDVNSFCGEGHGGCLKVRFRKSKMKSGPCDGVMYPEQATFKILLRPVHFRADFVLVFFEILL